MQMILQMQMQILMYDVNDLKDVNANANFYVIMQMILTIQMKMLIL